MISTKWGKTCAEIEKFRETNIFNLSSIIQNVNCFHEIFFSIQSEFQCFPYYCIEKKNRQINYNLVISFVKPLFSRNFCQKSVRVNISDVHTVYCTLWIFYKLTLTENKFRQINYLVISLVKILLSRNFRQKYVSEIFREFHTVYYASK